MSATRRNVLIGLAGLAAAGGAWAMRDAFGEDYGLLSSPGAAEAIGIAYAAEHGAPDLASIEAFLKEASDDAIAERIVTRVREDFAAGRIVQVQGWFFSKTEADLCAWVARG